MTTRRMILTTGAAAAAVLIGGATYRAWSPGTGPATAPWRAAEDGFGDPRLNALAYAILAPNPHNRQPWLFELVGDNQIDIRCQLDRRLPETDPFDRQIIIGFGCMLELLRQAAAEMGYAVAITPFPDGAPEPRLDKRRIASAIFTADAAQRDPLFQDVLLRRTNRETFDPAAHVAADTLATVLAAAVDESSAGGTVDADQVARLVDIAARGWRIEHETDATRRESIELMRIGNRAVADYPDGIAIDGVAMGLLSMAGVITPETLDTPGSSAYEQGFSMYLGLVESARGFVWIKTTDNARETQIAAGRDWVRMNLAAQALGLGIHPLSQVLQEFPEMAALYSEARQELNAAEGGVVQMLARIGYGKTPPPSPRWPLSSRLVDAGA